MVPECLQGPGCSNAPLPAVMCPKERGVQLWSTCDWWMQLHGHDSTGCWTAKRSSLCEASPWGQQNQPG